MECYNYRQLLRPLSARRFGQLRQLGSRPFGGRLGPEILGSVRTVTVLRTPPPLQNALCLLYNMFSHPLRIDRAAGCVF